MAIFVPMRLGFLCQCFLVLAMFLLVGGVGAQTDVFFEDFEGETAGDMNGQDLYFWNWNANCVLCSGYYEVQGGALEQQNSGGPATFITDDIDITTCNRLVFSMDYSGGPYAGVGNFEAADEFTACSGNPQNPGEAGCMGEWDFTYIELVFNDGSREEVEFIGLNSTDAVPTAVTYNPTTCLGDKSTVRIEITSQTTASTEITRFDNIRLECTDIPAGVLIDQNPLGASFCVGDAVELIASNVPGQDMQWFDPNGDPIGTNSNSISFSATSTFGIGSQIFSVIATDGMGCKTRGQWGILVYPSPTATLPLDDITVCAGSNVSLQETGGDATGWMWSGPSTAPPSTDTWNLNGVKFANGGTYMVTVTDGSGCIGTDIVSIIVEAGGAYTLDAFSQFCTNQNPYSLATVQGGINGNWSGPSVNVNVLEPSTLSAGVYELTFTPSASGCASPMTTNIAVVDAPSATSVSGPLSSCGTMTASFDLTSQDNVINGGSGLPVLWFEDAGLTMPIADPSNFDSPSATVYAAVSENGCNSDLQLLDLLLTPGPDIMMASTISGCGPITINNINILNDSGNQAYYDEPSGMGNVIPVGTIFTADTLIYAYDSNGSCSDEQMIMVLVGNQFNPGPDTLISLCASGFVNLLDLLSPSADPGNFLDGVGNPIVGNMIVAQDFFGVNLQLIYQTLGSGACPPATANYTLNVSPGNNAGPDSIGIVCFGQVLDVRSFTFDNALNGSLETLDGTSVTDDQIIFYLDDIVPFEEFNYIVNNETGCDADTSLIVITGQLGPSREVSGNVCSDYNIDINGTIYNENNPAGFEFAASDEVCDSVIRIDLHFLPENRVLRDDMLCTGQEITINQVVYDEMNPTGTEILIDQNGCDSIVDIDLSFDSQVTTLLDFLICGDADTLINGVTYNALNLTGSESFVTVSGCDSIVMVDLEHRPGSAGDISGIFCPSDSLFIDGDIYEINNPFGITESPFLNAAGCDSLTIVNMEFDMTFSETVDFDLCEDETVLINGNEYGSNNPQGREVITNANACDSVYNIDLNILKIDTTYIAESFCFDTTIVVNGVQYDRFNFEGTEVILGGSESGCRAYVFIELEFIESFNEDIVQELCLSDSLVVNGVRYDVDNPSGLETVLSSNGCDSVININLSFIGVQADIIASNPSCAGSGGGTLEMEILQDEVFLTDILLDGNTVLGQFQNGTIISGIPSGSHEVRFLDQRGCNITHNFTITDLGSADLSISSNLVNETYYQLNASFSGSNNNILWSPANGLSCTDCENPEARPELNTTYFVDVEDENGCTYRDSISLEFLVSSVLFQPNIFSPNEDGVNDLFFIESKGNFPFTNFMIYDRWGNNVYKNTDGSTGDSSDGWDGEGYSPGVYVYYLEITFPSGVRTIFGEVSLFR